MLSDLYWGFAEDHWLGFSGFNQVYPMTWLSYLPIIATDFQHQTYLASSCSSINSEMCWRIQSICWNFGLIANVMNFKTKMNLACCYPKHPSYWGFQAYSWVSIDVFLICFACSIRWLRCYPKRASSHLAYFCWWNSVFDWSITFTNFNSYWILVILINYLFQYYFATTVFEMKWAQKRQDSNHFEDLHRVSS